MARDTEYRNGRNPMQIADDAASGKPPQTEPTRPESKKSLWERYGMTREEYQRGMKQLADERRAEDERRARVDRARRGQSNPGN
jgi:hypothetical protein